ncbi:hypothetical protein GRI58_08575 [Porphyrobacter algicida]|uniref:Uncharacterized protein n=1 Tax=Qipengyuania algicida TaxID=1836209 RepID=A0A845AJ42_9SPHN|nr:hypothetical protein [Qipengyuania algicida]MXP28875.1 hypothetical protein [Qipengyuania algicida]
MAVWLTSHFAWRRTQSEKVWDRKADAYSTILQALNEMEASLDAWMSDEALRREPSDESSEERGVRYRQARARMQSVVGRELWLLNPAIKGYADELNKALSARYDSWFEDLDASLFAVRNTIKSVTLLAQEELQTSKTR